MKITKEKLTQIIRETVSELTEEKMITLELTQKEANSLLLALEQVEQSPEVASLYGKILDAGLAGAFNESTTAAEPPPKETPAEQAARVRKKFKQGRRRVERPRSAGDFRTPEDRYKNP
tara:strand:+ start:1871 stop:2227 length:357 start_codon:yes stop_codon:yes gene_type:complete